MRHTNRSYENPRDGGAGERDGDNPLLSATSSKVGKNAPEAESAPPCRVSSSRPHNTARKGNDGGNSKGKRRSKTAVQSSRTSPSAHSYGGSGDDDTNKDKGRTKYTSTTTARSDDVKMENRGRVETKEDDTRRGRRGKQKSEISSSEEGGVSVSPSESRGTMEPWHSREKSEAPNVNRDSNNRGGRFRPSPSIERSPSKFKFSAADESLSGRQQEKHMSNTAIDDGKIDLGDNDGYGENKHGLNSRIPNPGIDGWGIPADQAVGTTSDQGRREGEEHAITTVVAVLGTAAEARLESHGGRQGKDVKSWSMDDFQVDDNYVCSIIVVSLHQVS